MSYSFAPIPPETPRDRARFDSKLVPLESGCHAFKGFRRSKEYPGFQIGYKTYRAHRVAYVWEYGEEPNADLHHDCENPWCVNPEHLVPASAGQRRHRNVIRSLCANGHEFTPENTYLDPQTGWRQCITCKAARAAAAYAEMTDEERDALNARRRARRQKITYDIRPCQCCGLDYQPKRSDSRYCTRQDCINIRQNANRAQRKETG